MGDFLGLCMGDLQTSDQEAFTETFCKRCRQTECNRSQWSGDRFGQRVRTQTSRLLTPEQADPNSSRYQGLADFQDMLGEAIRLEASDRRGDWTVPEILVLDGRSEPSTRLVTNAVDDAFSQLGKARGRPSRMVLDEEPQMDEPEEQEEPQMDEPEEQPVLATAPVGQPATVAQPAKMGAAQVKMGNIPKPTEGLMIGGALPPPKTLVADDPWAAPTTTKTQVVQPGAKIKMGGGDGNTGR